MSAADDAKKELIADLIGRIAGKKITNEKELVSELIHELWRDVLKTVGKLLEADQKYTFLTIKENIDPSIEDIVFSLGIVDSILSVMENSPLLEHDQVREVLNSKQCVLHTKRLAEALDAGDQAEYDAVIELLTRQAKL